MQLIRFCFRAATLLLAASGAASASAGAPTADFYNGKQITMIIGTPAGTGNDVWGRIIARHMPNHLPEHPRILVQSMPGAGTIIAANYLYNIAPKDGTVIGNISRNLVTSALLNRPNIKFDPRKFEWIGSPEIENRVCVAATDSKIKTVQDLFTKELIVGGTGAGTMPTLLPEFINKFAGTKFKVVDGYPGSADVILALTRHEVEGVCVTYGLFKGPHAQLIENNKVKILFNSEPTAALPGVPSIFEFIKNEEDRQRLNFLVFSVDLGRPFVAPPDVSKERLDALRTAFGETMKDTAFLKETNKQGLDVTYRSGDELKSLILTAYETPRKVIDEVEGLIPQGGKD